jgi:heme/copper-type cytochrome/quinol oxidase subunit 2
MRGRVVVEEDGEYQAWLHDQKTFARMSAQASR